MMATLTKPKRSLGDIIDSISTQVDSIPDSCSEGSSASDDEGGSLPLPTPRPIPLTPQVALQKKYGREESKVEMSVGRGGRMVYQVNSGSAKYAEYFAVQWRKPQMKKTWDGDGFFKVEGTKIIMVGEEGDHMGVGSSGDRVVRPEQEFRIGNYDTIVDRQVTSDEFKASTSILNKPRSNAPAVVKNGYQPSTFAKPFRPPTQTHEPRRLGGYIPARSVDDEDDGNALAGPSRLPSNPINKPFTPVVPQKAVAAASFYSKPSPKPKVERIVLGEKSNKERLQWGGALHNPHAPGAVVMKRPDPKLGKLKGTDIIDVVVDPLLSAVMRDHQKEGVKFMYNCAMGMTDAEAEGCILADEMGLGKTLQTIALVYTLLKQSPFANQSSIVSKALIVCPVTLVDNWKREFKKWVDRRVNVVVADGSSNNAVSSFINGNYQQVLIIGYERLRKEIKKLAACVPPIDLIVCDEGHRLKSKDNKTTKMFEKLRTQRRIILSGTPVQNDLGEYWSMADFACPGLLGAYNKFVKHYEKPILKSRTPGCTAKELEVGKEKADALNDLSRQFVLRRTADVLSGYLPPKSRLLDPTMIGGMIRGAGAQSLALIDMMRKVSNSPMLLRKKDDEGVKAEEIQSVANAAQQAIPKDTNINDVTTSGKMLMLDKMLAVIHQSTEEKVVVVSNWTATLDLIQGLMKIRKYPFVRLDGSVPQRQRQELVETFNRDKKREESFVFLLSAKAGGVGLNLIGGSRLILFDSDWNPSTDSQAMARIHRDGQKRPVYIYRFLTTNAIDEKIYQRQLTKTGLSDQMLDQAKDTKNSFSPAELKDIFTMKLKTDGCLTHDLLGCPCTKPTSEKINETMTDDSTIGEDDDDTDETPGFVSAGEYDPEPTPKMRRKAAAEAKDKLAALKKWTHFDPFNHRSFDGVQDNLLYNILWDAWDGDQTSSSPTTSGDVEDDDDETVSSTKRKKRKVDPGSDDEQLSDGVVESDDDKVMDSHDEDEDEDEDGVGSDGTSTPAPVLPSKRKAMKDKAATGKIKKKSLSSNTDPATMRHDLKALAERGGTGRVTFVFEKLSRSSMDKAKAEAVTEAAEKV
ncbi:hypothetical protein CI109_102496 [Kwoniella shandongensis]|uniref:DNA repair and recombination protein RAD54B n=1 Tax=Kwoniella shandongensis TaxID=1734106 RepID=A0AAJ8LHQ1_9TREE